MPPTAHHLQETLAGIQDLLFEDIVPLEKVLLSAGPEAVIPHLAEIRAKVKAAGYWAPHLASNLGGMGLTMLEHGLVSEVLGQSPLGHYSFGCQAPDAGNAELLHLFGTLDQQQEYLLPLAKGSIRSCFGMTEKETPGSNPTQLKTQAKLVDGAWVINGEKWFTTGADGAAFCIVMAVTEPEAAAHQRASMIIVPMATPGLEHVRNVSVMGHSGCGPFSHGQLRFNDVRVAEGQLLGERGQGFRLAQARLGPGRIHHCMRWLGTAKRTLNIIRDHLNSRQVKPGMTLGASPLQQTFLAEHYAQYRAARLLVLDCAAKISDQGVAASKIDISIIKFFVANMLMKTIDQGIQSLGALGVSDDTVLSWFYREERAARIYDGPDEVHRISVGKALLRATSL